METGKDHDRRLTPKGVEDAHMLGAYMERKKLLPAAIFCSDAVRTTQTCNSILEKISSRIPVNFSNDFYDASRGELLQAIQTADNDLESLMLIGHNPAIYELSAMCASEGTSALLGRFDLGGYAPATLTVFEFAIENWEEIDPDQGVIKEYLAPSDYNAPSPSRWN